MQRARIAGSFSARHTSSRAAPIRYSPDCCIEAPPPTETSRERLARPEADGQPIGCRGGPSGVEGVLQRLVGELLPLQRRLIHQPAFGDGEYGHAFVVGAR